MDTLNTFASPVSAPLNGEDQIFTPQEPEMKPGFMPPMNISESHLPIVFVFDRSLSNALNGGDEEMQNSAAAIEASLQSSAKAAGCMDILIITFGREVRVLQDWVSGTDYRAPQLPEADGETPLYEALELALDNLQQRRTMYRQFGMSSYVGTIILVTDGAATDSERKDAVLARLHDMMHRNKVCIVPLGVGKQVDFGDLKEIADNGPILKAADASNFSEAINYLTDSMSDLLVHSGPSNQTTVVDVLKGQTAQDAPASEDDNCLDM